MKRKVINEDLKSDDDSDLNSLPNEKFDQRYENSKRKKSNCKLSEFKNNYLERIKMISNNVYNEKSEIRKFISTID